MTNSDFLSMNPIAPFSPNMVTSLAKTMSQWIHSPTAYSCLPSFPSYGYSLILAWMQLSQVSLEQGHVAFGRFSAMRIPFTALDVS